MEKIKRSLKVQSNSLYSETTYSPLSQKCGIHYSRTMTKERRNDEKVTHIEQWVASNSWCFVNRFLAVPYSQLYRRGSFFSNEYKGLFHTKKIPQLLHTIRRCSLYFFYFFSLRVHCFINYSSKVYYFLKLFKWNSQF